MLIAPTDKANVAAIDSSTEPVILLLMSFSSYAQAERYRSRSAQFVKIKGIHKPVGKYVYVVTPRNYRLNADQVSTESCEEISRR
jgi:hypothetical protein